MYYDDDGNELDPKLITMPELCRNCEKKDDPHEEILCNLTRFDQHDEDEFVCHAFVSLYGVLNDDIIE